MICNYNSSVNCNAGPLGPSLAEICQCSMFCFFLSLLNDWVLSNSMISGRCERVESIETPNEEYDFVVIGAGAAGSVVAGRLSENPDWKVLVLEAGSDEPAGAEVPGFYTALMNSKVDWKYTTTNESYACLAGDGSCPVVAGKVLGGGTVLNAMKYIRGNPKDYDNWAKKGNVGWTWDEVKRFYEKLEDSTGGPLQIEQYPYIPPIANSILAAAEEVGYGIIEDFNSEHITGLGIAQGTIKNGVRLSSASAFLRPAKNRKNLHVSLNSLATRVIIENDRAIGVEYHQNGVFKTVRVSREVVVSAGTMRSPQVLLLSGIGCKDHLKSKGVKVAKDLPGVGWNYHDHIGFLLNFTIDEPDEYDNNWAIAHEYVVNQTGPLSSTGLSQIMAMLKTEAASSDYPDLQFYFTGYMSRCAPGEVGALQSPGKRTVAIRAVNLRPRSRGRISLASNDPLEYPVIWGNYLSDHRDVDGLVDIIELGLKLADAQALRAHNMTLSTKPIEACSKYTFPSREYWACAIRQNTMTSDRHVAGTCKMGPSCDPMAVVDPRLRVHGIKGLRVADNSIMPQVTCGNTQAPAYMIGERAADFIKKDWAYYE